MVEFRVLGPVETLVDGSSVRLAAAKPRALLAVLLLNRNRPVPSDDLISDLWGDEPPETAPKALQVYVSQVRKAIGTDRVATKAPGYALRVEDGELDLDRFERLAAGGRELLDAGDAAAAAERLEEALALWRGPALAEFRSEPFARDAGARLEEARLAALEDRVEADLALGRHDRLVPELEELVGRHPLRERLRGQLMLALYRSDRQADALEVYRRTRETLVEELGIEPGPALQELERAILRHDPSLRVARRRPAPLAGPAAAPRRRPFVALGLVLALAAVGGVAAAFALTGDGGSSPSTTTAEDTGLRAFAVKVENILTESRDGRRAVAEIVGPALRCELRPGVAAARLRAVQRNRQSLLQQIAALSVPDDDNALRASDLLQRSLHASITADWHYRDWLLSHPACPPPPRNADLVAAHVADAKASRTKAAFVAAFDPLAQRFGLRAWSAGEF